MTQTPTGLGITGEFLQNSLQFPSIHLDCTVIFQKKIYIYIYVNIYII